MIRVAGFDWNGTLTNDAVMINDCRNATIQQFGGRPLTNHKFFEWYTRHHGDFLKVYYAAGVPESTPIDDLIGSFLTNYRARLDETVLFDGVKESLSYLSNQRGLQLALVTHMVQDFVEPMLEKLGLDRTFNHLSFGRMDKTRTLREILKKVDARPEEAFYMGDSPSDVASANEAGVVSIALKTDFVENHLMIRVRPQIAIGPDDWRRLPSILRRASLLI